MGISTAGALIGGLALFLWGISRCSKELTAYLGDQIRFFIGRFKSRPILGLLLGLFSACGLQSSIAVFVILINLADAGLIHVFLAQMIMFGADVGVTATVQILALRLNQYALFLIAAGVLIGYLSRGKGVGLASNLVVSLGLIFLGLFLVSNAVGQLKEDPLFLEIIRRVIGNPFASVLLSMLLCIILSSSAGTIGMTFPLLSHGIIPFEAALPVVVGANMGSAVIALMHSRGRKTEARRLGLLHFSSKFATGFVFFAMIPFLSTSMMNLFADPIRAVAMTHTLYNLTLLVLFVPPTTLLLKLAEKIIPTRGEELGEGAPHFLSSEVPESAGQAIGEATREIGRMGDLVLSQYDIAVEALKENRRDLLELVRSKDDAIDHLQTALASYITRIPASKLSQEQYHRVMTLLFVTFTLESIGDEIDRNISAILAKRSRGGYYFSDEGYAELLGFAASVRLNLKDTLYAFNGSDPALARQVLAAVEATTDEGMSLRRRHIARLQEGTALSQETTSIHVDLLDGLNNVSIEAGYVARSVLGDI